MTTLLALYQELLIAHWASLSRQQRMSLDRLQRRQEQPERRLNVLLGMLGTITIQPDTAHLVQAAGVVCDLWAGQAHRAAVEKKANL